MSCEIFRNILEEKFMIAVTKDEKRREFANLKQGPMSVAEYLRKFDELSQYAPRLYSYKKQKID
ncbi:hypothetical protein L484_025831 [Morus notabilis]|uniref:Retrotransposon gag domain-containing protein n=1 Tax=Morus notabilis TaxID=981085 RepID=W9RD13_9ROSA|nr:hypothetical protein L484_025831 [Morus notabilis]